MRIRRKPAPDDVCAAHDHGDVEGAALTPPGPLSRLSDMYGGVRRDPLIMYRYFGSGAHISLIMYRHFGEKALSRRYSGT
ncbi:hypothetical protein [Hamadaea tsunoensis]|uniref:hypothetical protein n=1 Tax=Hamadaea tsunoensis TaxID=53368 RepID=UPI0012F9F1D8|nr:hypothetical protein [Hamadaea tsunoensis]